MPETETLRTQCCIAGGGPAGLMLGYLLARAGVEVVVLEKHADFLRDFRGDTIHPSTLEVMHQLGLLEGLLALPHDKLHRLSAVFGRETLQLADFRSLPTHCRFIAFMPQWDFLNFLAEKAKRYPTFSFRASSEVTGYRTDGEQTSGLLAKTEAGALEVTADLVVAADGRHSALRAQSGLPVEDLGAPMDVVWFKLEKPAGGGPQALGHFNRGRILILLDRGSYWQCGYVIPKGSLARLRAEGFEAFRRAVAGFLPALEEPMGKLAGWDETSLLTVQVNRLETWHRPGLLFIGDAAHAMSPVGGIGINLAIQDAVAAANILAAPLREGSLGEDHLRALQKRRYGPTRTTQRLQVMIQNLLIAEALEGGHETRPPLPLRLMLSLPGLNRLPGRFVGLGVRRESVGKEILDR